MEIMLAVLREERQQTYSCFLPIHPETGRVLYVPIKEVNARDGRSASTTGRGGSGRCR
jgi:lysyl-tRNA synthetase class 1